MLAPKDIFCFTYGTVDYKGNIYIGMVSIFFITHNETVHISEPWTTFTGI